MTGLASSAVPAVDYIAFDAHGAPSLVGFRCRACDAVVLSPRMACPRCANPATLERIALATTGRLRSFTIVQRSFPGVETPFVSAVVALDGGGVLRGTLRDVVPVHDGIVIDRAVAVKFHPTGQRAADGREFLVHQFCWLEDRRA